KQLEKTKKSLEAKLAKLNDTSRKDDVITFEELGVDRIFVDEAHYYKNLFLYTKMRNVGGIAQTEAQKSSDLYMKCRYLDELTGGKGVIFATGTPVSNSMVELYTMQRYLQYNELEKRNLQHFDAWASTFGETTTAIELAPEGTGYRAKTRFAKFFNLPELMAMFKEVADIQTADMLNLPVPKAHYENVVVKPTEIQKEMVEELAERAERVRNKMVDATVDNMLKITNDGRKLALDQRLMNEILPDDPESKTSICANNIYRIWQENKDKHLTQLVFCDLSTPHNDGKFNVYDDVKNKLKEKGVPDDEVSFIHYANTDIRKQELFNKVRKGQVRVLMGSTQKMGAGTNCQDKLIALHDLDCPWRPSDLIQRSGRIIRQGNQNSDVYIYRYVTEGTFDAYLYQLVENKQRFISQIMTSKTPVRFAEDIDETALSYAEIKALAAGNPLIIEKTELDTQVAKLKLLKQTHLSQIYAMEDKVIKFYPNEIKRLEKRLEDISEDVKHLTDKTKITDGFQGMVIDGKEYIEKADAGQKIIDICKAKTNPEPIEIGEYRGFKMNLSFDTTDRKFHLSMKNNLSYDVELGADVHGNITRIDNVLNGIESKIEYTKNNLDDTKKQFENAKQEITRPFPQEEELKTKSKRLDELNIALNLNEKEKEIIADGNDDVSDDYNRNKDRER
ncbi:MAG: helicase, partial [Clostridia bacterium]|nr:helicase [Clostridia bacterium]